MFWNVTGNNAPNLTFKMPDTSDSINCFDRKIITVCVVAAGATSYTMNFQVYNSSDIINGRSVPITFNKSSVSFILDRSTTPSWLYVDSGS